MPFHLRARNPSVPTGPAARVYALLEQATLDNLDALTCELLLKRIADGRPLGVRERGEMQRLWAQHMEEKR